MPSTSIASRPLEPSTRSSRCSALLSMIARLNVECGAAGITSSPSTVGDTIGPPAEYAYAVEPVGVAMTTASAAYRTNGCPSTTTSTAATLSPGMRTRATSLNAVRVGSQTLQVTAIRGSIVYAWASTADSASSSSAMSTSARKPSRPKLTPSTGRPCGPASRSARSIVPSPPRLITRLDRAASSSGVDRDRVAGDPGDLVGQRRRPAGRATWPTAPPAAMAWSGDRCGCSTTPTLLSMPTGGTLRDGVRRGHPLGQPAYPRVRSPEPVCALMDRAGCRPAGPGRSSARGW